MVAGIVTVITVLWKVQNSFATPAPAENRRGEHGKVEFAELAREYTEFYIQKLTQQTTSENGKQFVVRERAGTDL